MDSKTSLRQETCASVEGPSRRGTAPGSRPSLLLRAGVALLRCLLRLRYDVRVRGLERIKPDQRPILFLPNHPALIDPVLLYALLGPDFKPRPLADEAQMRQPLNGLALRLAGAISLPDLKRQGRSVASSVRLALQQVSDALRRGENVLFYPSGKLTCNGREELGGNGGVSRLLADVPTARTVLVRSRGLWGSRFSRAAGHMPRFANVLARSCLWLVPNLLFFLPRRQVEIVLEERVLQHPGAEAGGDRACRLRINGELEAFYNEGLPDPVPAVTVPMHFLQSFTFDENSQIPY